MIPQTTKKSGYDNLMTAVLTTQIQDYINAREITDYSLQQEISSTSKKIKSLNKTIESIGIGKTKSLDAMIKNIEKEVRVFLLHKKLARIGSRRTLCVLGERARQYIFEDMQPIFKVDDITVWDKEKKKNVLDKKISSKIIGYTKSDEYVFGFKFVCSYLGLDPIKFRKKIKELRIKHIKELQSKIKEF